MSHDIARGAAATIEHAIRERLRTIDGLRIEECDPRHPDATPSARVEADLERDWSHKTGRGREVRVSIVIRDGGMSDRRLRGLSDGAEAAIADMDDAQGNWRIVSIVFVECRLSRRGRERTATIQYRARLLEAAD
jgi:hypothetical protein